MSEGDGGDRFRGGNGMRGVYFGVATGLLGYHAETRFESDCLRDGRGRVLRVEGSSWKLASCKQIDQRNRE